MRKLSRASVAVILICGCGSDPSGNDATAKASVPPPSEMVLAGPGGSVGIGDTLDSAKKAFPSPQGATVFDQSMSYAILGKQGWGWGSEDGKRAFEVAIDGGKIVALAQTSGTTNGEPEATIKRIGEPTRKATGKSVEVYVWEAGDNARFLVQMKESAPLLPSGTITLIGNKEQLKLLSYRYDDPKTFVDQMDASSQLASSPELKKAFAEAKQKALAKAKKKAG